MTAPDAAPLAAATERLLRSIADLSDAAARQPSVLPDWTVGHVLTHIARNADGNRNMLEGAAVGETRDQYPHGREGRAADIEAGAARPAAALVEDVRATSAGLAAAVAAMTEPAWEQPVRSFGGTYPAREALVSRRREVEVHHADLGLAYSPADWPADFVAGELAWVAAGLGRRLPAGVAVRLEPSGAPAIDAGEGADAHVIAGSPGWLLWWLMGRPVPAGVLDAEGGLPSLGAWP